MQYGIKVELLSYDGSAVAMAGLVLRDCQWGVLREGGRDYGRFQGHTKKIIRKGRGGSCSPLLQFLTDIRLTTVISLLTIIGKEYTPYKNRRFSQECK